MKNLNKIFQKLKLEDILVSDYDDYTFVCKPPHLSSLQDRSSPYNLHNIAIATHSQYQLCHRLDKETSGILVLSKNATAYTYLTKQLAQRTVYKEYHAVIKGIHDLQNVEIEAPIFIGTNKSKVDFKRGKPSKTIINTLEKFKNTTLISCQPVTGRMHQIRVHLAYYRCPIVNDHLYGGEDLFLSEIKKKYSKKEDQEERPILARTALHAYKIRFKEQNGGFIEESAPYPKDFTVLVKQLRQFK